MMQRQLPLGLHAPARSSASGCGGHPRSVTCNVVHRRATRPTTGQKYQHEGSPTNEPLEEDANNSGHKLPALVALLTTMTPAAANAVETALTASSSSGYTPSPLEIPSWQIWVGFVAGVVPFIIASYEFGKRILIQRRCPECEGKGLVQRGRYLRKCANCGGMLPWLGWKAFWFSNLNPGNGGPLLQPRGQTSVLYSVPPPRAAAEKKASTGEPGQNGELKQHPQPVSNSKDTE